MAPKSHTSLAPTFAKHSTFISVPPPAPTSAAHTSPSSHAPTSPFSTSAAPPDSTYFSLPVPSSVDPPTPASLAPTSPVTVGYSGKQQCGHTRLTYERAGHNHVPGSPFLQTLEELEV